MPFELGTWIVTNLKPDIDLDTSPPVSRIVLEFVGQQGIEGNYPVPTITRFNHLQNKLVLTFDSLVLNMPDDTLEVFDGLIQTVSWQKTGRSVQIILNTQFPAIVRLNFSPGIPAQLALELSRSSVVCLLAEKKVALDPGHGGKDTGAVGVGYRECDIVLKISRMLNRWLTAHGAVCLLTRDEDIYLPDEKRVHSIVQEKPDVFLSLHTGAHKDSKQRGCTVLYQPGRNDKELAHILHQAILKKNPFLVDGGVRPGHEKILSGVMVPAAKVCPEYITHPLGEGLLRDIKFQERVAQSLFAGLVSYFLTRSKI